jgi:protein-disulfide isomerase
MTSSGPAGRPSSGNTTPPTSRRSARQQRLASREANRNLARAGTGGSNGGRGSLMMWSLVAVVIAAVLVGSAIFLSSQGKGSAVGAPIAPGVLTPATIPSSGRTLGNPDAKVTIDLWGDFRCTACFVFAVEGTEKKLIDEYVTPGKAKLVWHDFTIIDLNQGNNASRDAANAARCAADQGKFWTMHDWLYANQDPGESPESFSKARLSDIAKSAGMDMGKFQPCLDDGTHNDAVAAESGGRPTEIQSTPSVFINGKLTDLRYESLKAAIDAALGIPAASPSATA